MRKPRKQKDGRVGVGVGASGVGGSGGLGAGYGEAGQSGYTGHGVEGDLPETKVAGLPNIGTWKRDMTGGGGSGEGGRGMYDDYDVDEDDY